MRRTINLFARISLLLLLLSGTFGLTSCGEEASHQYFPETTALEKYVHAQVALHNEVIAAGPEAMDAFLKKYSAEDFQAQEINFSEVFIRNFSIRQEVVDQLAAAYLPFEDLPVEELAAESKKVLEQMHQNGQVTILTYAFPAGLKSDCNCGQVVFEAIFSPALVVVTCGSCFGGFLPACPGCLWGAGSAIGSLQESWDCGCWSQDMSPYQ